MKKIIKKYKKTFTHLTIISLITIPQFVSAQAWNPASLTSYGLPNKSIYDIVTNFLSWILIIFGFIGIIGFAISGIIYILSAGDDDRMKTAKQAMQYSIIGVIVGLSGLVIIKAVNTFLSANGTPI